MRAMMTAFAVTILITVGANVVLENLGFSAQDVGSSNSVRLD